jgi:16S rRNA G966 N2-methylase RsmD
MPKNITALSDLTPDDKNANRGTARGREAVRDSLSKLGAGRSILVDKNGRVIAGNKTLEAALAAGLAGVITVETTGDQLVVVQRTDLDLDDAKARELGIADNRAGQLGLEWDAAVLSELSGDVELLEYFNPDELKDMGVDLSTGIGNANAQQQNEDEVPEVQPEAISIVGDLWHLGDHRLICADCTEPVNLDRLSGGTKIDMVYTDPPYGVSIVNVDGKVSTGLPPGPGLSGKVGGSKPFGTVGNNLYKTMRVKPIIESNFYAPIIGDDSTATAIKAFNLCATLKPSPTLIFWGGNYYASALPDSSCWIVWDKNNGESFFADAELAWTNQKTAVRIFKHTWNGLIKESERGEKRCHPTQKPVALAEWCFDKYGDAGDSVLDLFGGSGSTLIACEKQARTCYMAELSPHYIDVIIRRWQTFTGEEAVLNGTGQTFADVTQARSK